MNKKPASTLPLKSSFFGLLFLSLFCFSQATMAYHIIVDPGHGGRDKGASKKDIIESRIVLKVAKLLEEALKKDPQFKVSMTRQSDDYISLRGRGELAMKFKGDVFVSIHVNSSPDSRAHGAEFYFQNQLPPDEESLFLAARENNLNVEDRDRRAVEHHTPFLPSTSLKPEVKTILLDLVRNHKILDSSLLTKTLKEHWRGEQRSSKHSIRQAPFYVVSKVPIPSVLIELGFITNSKEAKKLLSSDYQNLVAQSIYEGLVAYKELSEKQR